MPQAPSRVRWWILSLLFLATTINYLDRIVLSVLQPTIVRELGMNNQSYSYVLAAFQWAYTMGFLLMGWFIDRFGTRLGYALAIVWWSVAAMLHPLARNVADLGFWRAMLGLGEAGNFPAAVKAVSEWFPRQERAFAIGIFNSGTNIASMFGPYLFAIMAENYGWRSCFVITGSLGLVWLVLWWFSYRLPGQHAQVNAAELTHIQGGQEEPDVQPPMSWREVTRYRQTWGFAGGKLLTDPVWWFYLFWLSPYLSQVWQFNQRQIGVALLVVYGLADLGSIAGGWLSSRLIQRGWPVGKARKTAMGVFAAMMPFSALAIVAPTPWAAVLLASIATAGHQGWSANLYTITSDVFPRRAVASVTGLGGFLGGLSGIFVAAIIPGYVVQHFGFGPVFAMMGCFHLIAWAVVHNRLGDFRPVEEARQPVLQV